MYLTILVWFAHRIITDIFIFVSWNQWYKEFIYVLNYVQCGSKYPPLLEKIRELLVLQKIQICKINGSEESFISNSSWMGMLISPLSLADLIPSPIESIQSANFLISSCSTQMVEARKRIFVVIVRTLQLLQNFDELMDEASMSCLHPFFYHWQNLSEITAQNHINTPKWFVCTIDTIMTLYRAWFGQTPQNNNDASSVPHPILLIFIFWTEKLCRSLY